MSKIFLYAHTGSGNHGCEAIVRSTVKILALKDITVCSSGSSQDKKYGLDKICEIDSFEIDKNKYFIKWLFCAVLWKLGFSSMIMKYKVYYNLKHFKYNKESLFLSIGGDNYCYKESPKALAYCNNLINENQCKTVLWGCSIEPSMLKNPEIISDLNKYRLIIARESITYDALKNSNISTKVMLYPDPAFQLPISTLQLPANINENNIIGINLSPLIIEREKTSGVTMQNYRNLLLHIIKTTNLDILLIPHVVWESNDDRGPLLNLYNEFHDTGRVYMIEDHNCNELKGFISRTRMFIGARTHSIIAAYSTCVPTLAIGYSVKAKGIAKDIFGTYENYVIPVQALENEYDIIRAFEWLKDNETYIRENLQKFMPSYIEKAFQAGREVKKLL